jgi:predicted metalloprotease with PDZ domain
VAAALLLPSGGVAAQAEDIERAEKAQREEALQQAYEEALAAASQERQDAQEAMERAREEMARASTERAMRDAEAAEAREAYYKARETARRQREEELTAMREELSRAHEQLRQASREVARVHRELELARGATAPAVPLLNLGDRAVIGVILGDSDKSGVQVLGVSPDGPAERAGIEQGDIIVAVQGERLVSDEDENAGLLLQEVMEGVQAGDELQITVNRGGEDLDVTVTAELREPFGWASIVRLPSAPMVPGHELHIERIEIPTIDKEALAEKMGQIREEIDRARIVIEARQAEGLEYAPQTWEFEFDKLSDIGEEAMLGANLWFGMPLTRGLKFAEVDAGLGEYFKTDRGVLVLKAKDDNDLQLQSGDVILSVGGTDVDNPSDVMRALREVEPGSNLQIGIMRDRKKRSIDIVVPERKAQLGFAPKSDLQYFYHFKTEED